MDLREAIKTAVAKSGETLKSASIKAGRSANNLGNVLRTNSGDIGAGSIASYADACGYALALIPKSDVPESALVIDPREANQKFVQRASAEQQARKSEALESR